MPEKMMSEALTQTLHSPSDIISAKEKTTGLMELNRDKPDFHSINT